jgi:hypothetical protein
MAATVAGNPASTDPELYALRRELLNSAIGDVQGSIHGNDDKCAGALIVHGLLFAGTVSVASRLEPLWGSSGSITKALVVLTLGIAAPMMMISIGGLLLALMPAAPMVGLKEMVDAQDPPGVFFPVLAKLDARGGDRLTPYLEDLERVDGPASVEKELAFELVKLQGIRMYNARCAKVGYRALFAEALAAVLFLCVVGLAAI